MGKVEPTTKQKKTADILIEQQIKGENLNRGKAMEEAGYSESMQKTPTAVTKSVGFLAYMEDAGITEQNLATMLAEDLSGKPKERLGEMKLAAQLMGLDGAKDGGANVQVNVALERMQSIIDAEVIDDNEEVLDEQV